MTGTQDSNGQWVHTTGGMSDIITPTITVDTAVYASGDCIGGVITLSNAIRPGPGTGLLTSINLIDRANQGFGLELLFFGSNPTGTGSFAATDNAAFVLSTADAKLLAHVTIATSDWVSIGSRNVATITGIGKLLKSAIPAVQTDLYMVIVAKGAFDFVAATDLIIGVGISQD